MAILRVLCWAMILITTSCFPPGGALPNDLKRTEQDSLAEHYRGFLLYLLREEWRANGPRDVTTLNSIHSIQSDGKGLYFLFWSAYKDSNDVNKQDQIYPLYVGITGRSFKQRMTEHYYTGIINKIITGTWPTQGMMKNLPSIVAYFIELPLPVAKFLESVFLYAFNFAMNTEENDGERPEIDITRVETVQEGLQHFESVYNLIKASLSEADKMISNSKDGSGAMNLYHYQLQ